MLSPVELRYFFDGLCHILREINHVAAAIEAGIAGQQRQRFETACIGMTALHAPEGERPPP